jgi:hypothetical protein
MEQPENDIFMYEIAYSSRGCVQPSEVVRLDENVGADSPFAVVSC